MFAESRIALTWLCLGLWLSGRWRDKEGSSGHCLHPRVPGPPVTSSYRSEAWDGVLVMKALELCTSHNRVVRSMAVLAECDLSWDKP